MKKSEVFFTSLLAFIFIIEGCSFLISIHDSLSLMLYGSAAYSAFIAFIHFFIAYGIFVRAKWAPHLGIFFEAYLVANFMVNNARTISSTVLLPSAVTLLSVSAFVAASLFVLRDKFTQ